ncbi:DUF1800 domain-containing protein [Cytophagaceae bacterium YF14B1]|uniref:DUF1800 domain-containing protein n=1 Tax=Xanthocytophaga flava TaxID=3048013 RepID=A0AAE3QY23_9BACT|nr:DUF1800 domain-containing protein [Xanthocytophaga flavus]MDJ1484568.1 DUF1800 domain-containing protein [Xanthocytophaga flavus]
MQTKISNQQKIKHLYNRAGFGISPLDIKEVGHKSVEKAVKELFVQSKNIYPLQIVTAEQMRLEREEKKDSKQTFTQSSTPQERIKTIIKDRIESIKSLNLAWVSQMVSGNAMLREKMTLFWHGHFACRSNNAYFMQIQNNTLRKHALGKFGDLLMAISKDAAMLGFLNNKQNRKDSPNENFAREVMELFTLGRDHYTEQDIKNAARAFTGWQFRHDGEFFFNQRQHDEGEKTFFGKTGNFTGEDILTTILENKQTARFITTKIYQYFVNEKPDPTIINSLSDQFYKSDYDIAQLMESIFTADWFYQSSIIGSRVKSPVELLVGLQQTFTIQFQETQNIIFLQKVLGQTLLNPPNVAGWKEGKNWIDSSSLLFRMQLPELLFQSAEVKVEAKEEGDVNTAYLNNRKGKTIQASANWAGLQDAFMKVKDTETLDALASYLLSLPITLAQKDLIWRRADKSSKEALIKSLSSALVSLPEYQLC